MAPLSYVSSAFTVDATLNRAYAFFEDESRGNNNVPWTLETFNLQQMTPIAETRLSGISSLIFHQKVVRWRPNGRALLTDHSIQIISGSFVTQ